MQPTRKMSAAAIGGAVAVVVTWGLGLVGVDVPAAVGAAFGTIGSFAAGFFTSEP